MMKTCAVLLMLAGAAATLPAAAPNWDTSGNGLLSGNYYFRQVLYVADANGNVTEAISLYGTITFNNGTYTLSNLGGLDYQNGTPNLNTVDTYSLSASGYGFLSDPLLLGNSVSFLVSNGILIGSDTESGYNEMFVAAPITTLNNANFKGSYTVSAYDPQGLGYTYQLNPDGAGHLGNFTINGYIAGGGTVSQTASNISYRFSGNAAVITYPTNSNATFYSGQEFVYFSPDTNFVFGGNPNWFDMFVGVKNAGSGASTPLSGLYYEAGVEESAGIDSYYGTINASNGDIIAHDRLLFSGGSPYGATYWASYPTTIAGSYTDSTGAYQYTIGLNGFRLTYGLQGYLSMGIAIPYTPPAPSGAVYIDPTGIVNTASSAPYTAGISPGEFLTFYNGVNLAPSTTSSNTVPYPTSLNGVKVMFNDVIAAPIFYVSSNQVSVIVPYDVSVYPNAKIQISNNGVLSNAVTVKVNNTTPGVFTSDPVGGIGVAALLDFPAGGGYYIVTNDQPAYPGDNVALYLTGLGAPYPSNPSGAAGPIDGDSLTAPITVMVGGENVGTLAYSGLAPGLAGLYQINFTIPSDAAAGQNVLSVGSTDSNSDESYIPIALSGSVRPSTSPLPAVRIGNHARSRR
ncbi:MAG TPA: hypothetical protein VHC90_06525 [Bryobacteraceae bacterium]|nr:hypothetical protein [Bryobacteraceae bacterium]